MFQIIILCLPSVYSNCDILVHSFFQLCSTNPKECKDLVIFLLLSALGLHVHTYSSATFSRSGSVSTLDLFYFQAFLFPSSLVM